MGLKENKEAVKIDDWVHDIRGTLVGWVDATPETPPGFNEEAVRLVYAPHSDSSKSIIKKFVAPVGRFLFDAFGNTAAFEVSEAIYPKSAIDGYPDGKTVDGFSKEAGTPEKRVILKNDVSGMRSYMDSVGPDSEGNKQKVSELKDKINDLKMQLQAEESKAQELEQEVDRDEGKSKRRRSRRWGPDEYDMADQAGGETY